LSSYAHTFGHVSWAWFAATSAERVLADVERSVAGTEPGGLYAWLGGTMTRLCFNGFRRDRGDWGKRYFSRRARRS